MTDTHNGSILDVSRCPLWAGKYYDVTGVFEGPNSDAAYADYKTNRKIESIGRHKVTGNLYASPDTTFYDHPDFECVWLR